MAKLARSCLQKPASLSLKARDSSQAKLDRVATDHQPDTPVFARDTTGRKDSLTPSTGAAGVKKAASTAETPARAARKGEEKGQKAAEPAPVGRGNKSNMEAQKSGRGEVPNRAKDAKAGPKAAPKDQRFSSRAEPGPTTEAARDQNGAHHGNQNKPQVDASVKKHFTRQTEAKRKQSRFAAEKALHQGQMEEPVGRTDHTHHLVIPSWQGVKARPNSGTARLKSFTQD